MVSLKSAALSLDARICDAVRAIEESRRGIAVVTDAAGILQGTLTDGDIRRLILRGGGLDSPISEAMNRTPVTAKADTPDHQLAALLQDHSLEALPVLEDDGRFARIVHIRDLLPEARESGSVADFVAAVIMAGGQGTRLRPITATIPKPMVEVGGIPLLERHIRRLERARISRVFLAVNYLAHMIEDHCRRRPQSAITIDYLRENQRMGTAGALSLLPTLPPGPLLVLNADVVHAADYVNLLTFHRAHKAALTMATVEHHVQIPYGVVHAKEDRVLRLEEKPSQRYLCNAGIYVLDDAARSQLVRSGPTDMTDIIAQLMAGGENVCAFPMHEYWADIADADDLARVHREIWKLDGVNER